MNVAPGTGPIFTRVIEPKPCKMNGMCDDCLSTFTLEVGHARRLLEHEKMLANRDGLPGFGLEPGWADELAWMSHIRLVDGRAIIYLAPHGEDIETAGLNRLPM